MKKSITLWLSGMIGYQPSNWHNGNFNPVMMVRASVGLRASAQPIDSAFRIGWADEASPTQTTEEAVTVIDFSEFTKPDSTALAKLAECLLNQGIKHRRLKQWQEAEQCYQQAEKIYQELGAEYQYSPLMESLAATLMNLGTLYLDQKQYNRAIDHFSKAEVFLRQLSVDNQDSRLIEVLARALMHRGNLLHYHLQQYDTAMHCYSDAEVFFLQLGADNQGSPLMESLAHTLSIRGGLHKDLQQYDTAKAYALEAFSLYERLQTYDGRFLDGLLDFSRGLLIPLFNNNTLATFQRLAKLVFRYQDQQHQAQLPFERRQDALMDLWEVWLLHALHTQDSALLLAVVSASYARRLSLLAHLQAEHSTPFLDLTNRLEQLRIQLDVLDYQLLQTPEPKLQQQYQQVLSQYNALYRQRGQLMQADSFDALHTLFNGTELQHALSPDSAILFSISFADYKLEQVDDEQQPNEPDRPPLLLLLLNNKILKVDAPALNTAAHALKALYHLQTQNPIASVRHAQYRKPTGDFVVPEHITVSQAMTDIKQAMSEVWQTLQEQYLTDIKHLTIVGHGKLNGLPWQGFQPPDLNVSVRQYAGLYALPARKHSRYKRLYPSATTPLAVLANAADYDPQLHLYYVEAEVLMIQRVWGQAAVKRISDLTHAPENSLLLLIGHGNQQQGRGVFVLNQDTVLDQYDILAHQRPLHALGASACLLARSEDINAEPLGLLSLATCCQDVQFNYGALNPIDDFLTTCLSLLFHVAWRDSQDPNFAMCEALKQLETGNWSDDAQRIFKEVFTEYLPVMFAKMETDKRTYHHIVRQRIANCRQDWQESPMSKAAYKKWERNQQTELTHNLVSCVLNDLMQITPHFQNKLTQFLPFWLWG